MLRGEAWAGDTTVGVLSTERNLKFWRRVNFLGTEVSKYKDWAEGTEAPPGSTTVANTSQVPRRCLLNERMHE